MSPGAEYRESTNSTSRDLSEDSSQSPKSSDQHNMLIVGDWVVDENWIVTTEKSPTSSHVGKQQYRSLIDDPKGQILTVCAAGSSMLMLHGLQDERLRLYGLGLWDENDTEFLASLFCSEDVAHQTPLTIQGIRGKVASASKPPQCRGGGACLFCNGVNEKGEYECTRLFSYAEKDSGTWRVQRVYQKTGAKAPELLHRYDWEIFEDKKPKEGVAQQRVHEKLAEWGKKVEKFHSVVIVDHNKGAVTEEVMSELSTNKLTRGAKWYARCKDPRAEWFRKHKQRMTLVVFGPHNLELEQDPWFLGDHLSPGALEWLCDKAGGRMEDRPEPGDRRDLYKVKERPSGAAVTLHLDNRAAMLLPKSWPGEGGDQILVATKYPTRHEIRVGRHSVLLAALVALREGLLRNRLPSGEPSSIRKRTLELALDLTHAWCDKTQEVLLREFWKNKKYDFRGQYRSALKLPAESQFSVTVQEVDDELRDWSQAHNPRGLGIVESDGTKPRLEIWRGWSAIDNIISLVPQRRKEIGSLVQAVKEFEAERRPRRSLSSLIIGGPGWGKSALVERLARSLKMDFVEFNITHLTSIEDLIGCFDNVSSRQAQDPDRRLVIFWDEINAEFGGQPTYPYFLSPLWNGTYRRGGQMFTLRPSVWIFAGTRELHRLKASDFMSRLNGPIVRLRGGEVPAEEGQADGTESKNGLGDKPREEPLEQLYMAAALMKRRYPNIRKIERSVLAFFMRGRPCYGLRSMEYVIENMRNVSHDSLMRKNLPKGWERWVDQPDDTWKESTGVVELHSSLEDRRRDTRTPSL